MSLQKDFKDVKRIWCPGCGLWTIEKILAEEFENMKWNRKNTVVVSGIGCTARISEYFNLDTIHTSHGRTLPVAEGIKIANPDINVVVISGDGDLLGIGGNHLIHSSRRNVDVKVFCNNNRIYAMTGGQTAPTSSMNMKTKTHPDGNNVDSLNVRGILMNNSRYFFAKTNSLDLDNFRRAVRLSLTHVGFSFVEIFSPCVTDIGRRIGSDSFKDILDDFKEDKERFVFDVLRR